MKRVCNQCGKEQDVGYDPYYLFSGEILCEACLLKRCPVKEVTYYYSTYDEDYYSSLSEALEWMSDKSYVDANEGEEDEVSTYDQE